MTEDSSIVNQALEHEINWVARQLKLLALICSLVRWVSYVILVLWTDTLADYWPHCIVSHPCCEHVTDFCKNRIQLYKVIIELSIWSLKILKTFPSEFNTLLQPRIIVGLLHSSPMLLSTHQLVEQRLSLFTWILGVTKKSSRIQTNCSWKFFWLYMKHSKKVVNLEDRMLD